MKKEEKKLQEEMREEIGGIGEMGEMGEQQSCERERLREEGEGEEGQRPSLLTRTEAEEGAPNEGEGEEGHRPSLLTTEKAEKGETTEKEEKGEIRAEVVKARLEGYARGRGIEPEVLDAAVEDLTRIGKAVADGDINLDMLELVITGRDHKKILAEAVREAELRGRNAAIEAKMRESVTDDGVPHLGSSGATRKATRRSIFSLAQSAR